MINRMREVKERHMGDQRKIEVKEIGRDLKGYVRQYCEVSSIQGLSYMINTNTLVGRIWWIIIFALGIAGSCWMVYEILDKWTTTPVLVSLATKEDTINGIPFPAVTLCPEAKISRTCLNYTDLLIARRNGKMRGFEFSEHMFYDYMASICRPENHQSTISILTSHRTNGTQSEEEEDDNGPDLSDYGEFFRACKSVELKNAYCSWMGQSKNCKDILTPILTDQGLCYSFNMYDVRDIFSEINDMEYYPETSNRRQDWNPDKGFSDGLDLENMYPRRSFLSGANNALVVVILTDKDDLNYACQDFALQGMRVTLHTASRIPRLGQIFFSVGLDRLTTVSVTPSVTETSNRIKQYSPEKRACFFGYEKKLKYFKYYSQSSCNFECWTNYTISKCGCVAFYMPRDNMTKVCNVRKRFCLENARVSYNEDILRQRLNTGTKVEGNATTVCNCLPLCSDVTYNAEIAASEWNFNDDDEVEFDDTREEMSRYRASAIKVFFKNRYFLPNQRDELYGTSDMVSNIGGALSLFTGFALVSLAEIIYFLSIKLIDNYRRYHHWAGPKVILVQE
ncbi:pickpocket protein 28-like [Coccinella septempunctata]|uniref:pickpocket protein 28-like n=1 Tax=Coccinella septempunctata TaxID=41139 RepID=UPI001D089E3E|nr:pickpocket protein 28-like [Coccinella septempunctata]